MISLVRELSDIVMGNIVYDFLIQPRFRLLRHLLYLFALAPIALTQAFFVLGGVSGVSEKTIYQFGFGFALALLAVAYFGRFVLTPVFLLRDRYAEFLIYIWLSLFVLVGLKYRVESMVIGEARVTNWVTLLDWASNCTLYSICIASSSTPFLFRRWVQDQGQIDDLEKERIAYHLEDYKNRINPQLIKASILYAADRVIEAPQQVSTFLQRLSDTLRYQLYDYQRDRVLLKSELQFLRHVIALRQQVTSNAFDLVIHTTGNLNRFIAPGLFLPLVESVMELAEETIEIELEAPAFGSITFQIATQGVDLRDCNLAPLEQRLRWLDVEHRLSTMSDTLTLQVC